MRHVLALVLLWCSLGLGALAAAGPALASDAGACPVWKARDDVAAAKRALARAEARLREARRVLEATRIYSDRYGAGTGRWVRAARRVGWQWRDIAALMCVVETESGGNPGAVNASSGAAGLLQFLPAWWSGKWDPYDGPTNLRHGRKAYADQGWAPWAWYSD